MDWNQTYQLHQIRHAQLISESGKWNSGRKSGTAENEERAQTITQEKRVHVQGREECLEMLTPYGQKAVRA